LDFQGTIDFRPQKDTLSRKKYLLLDGADGLARVEALRTGLGAVHDGMAAVQLERVVQLGQALGGALVTTVLNPSAEENDYEKKERDEF